MKAKEIRKSFIEFFQNKSHTYVPGNSTIPHGDQTILFTIAGMAQFKAALSGEETRPYKRATNAQKCIRVADLDDVGKDGRHLTLFEMMGSWSFGDYFKQDAIAWAWEFTRDHLKFDMGKLWTTVHHSDQEAYDLWKAAGQPEERIRRLGDKDNFWKMGNTGPCGPCTELYIDMGPEVGKCEDKSFDCKAGPGCDCDRYLEYWNLVFMQYDLKEDGTLEPLPFKSVDTGSGLERAAMISQGVSNAYDTDLFTDIKAAILDRAGYGKEAVLSRDQVESLQIIADHMRMLSFTLADGVTFSNEGRGYVLRRVLRRAVRHAHRLAPNFSRSKSFLEGIVPTVVAEMGEFYPELCENEKRIRDMITTEELRFVATLEAGLTRFHSFVEAAKARHSKSLPGEQVFALHDTFGFPADLTRILAEEAGLGIDLKGYEALMAEQKEKSRADARFYKFDKDDSPWVTLHTGDQSDEKSFQGYGLEPKDTYQGVRTAKCALPASRVRRVRQLKNHMFELVVAHTPFYPESGGQTADQGWILAASQVFEIVDVRKSPSGIVHVLRHGEFSDPEAETLSKDTLTALFSQPLVAHVNMDLRLASMRNHTATHLLHKALQVVLGDGIRQAGSLVSGDLLRFDFTHGKALSASECERIENLVNAEILMDSVVNTHEDVALDKAKSMGATAIFDEKYEDKVRVVEVQGFSLELCGGTHVSRTGQIGQLRILSEGSVTAGVRRIEAVTGWGALQAARHNKDLLHKASDAAKCAEGDLLSRIEGFKDSHKDMERSVAQLQSRLANAQLEGLLQKAQKVKGVSVVAALVEAQSLAELELLADRIKEKHEGVVALGAALEGKAQLVCAVSPSLNKAHKALSAGQLVKQLSEKVDGKGGGRPDFAKGGGSSPEKLPGAMALVLEMVDVLV